MTKCFVWQTAAYWDVKLSWVQHELLIIIIIVLPFGETTAEGWRADMNSWRGFAALVRCDGDDLKVTEFASSGQINPQSVTGLALIFLIGLKRTELNWAPKNLSSEADPLMLKRPLFFLPPNSSSFSDIRCMGCIDFLLSDYPLKSVFSFYLWTAWLRHFPSLKQQVPYIFK